MNVQFVMTMMSQTTDGVPGLEANEVGLTNQLDPHRPVLYIRHKSSPDGSENFGSGVI